MKLGTLEDLSDQEAIIVRAMGDQAAFEYLTNKFSPASKPETAIALRTISKRPWKRQYHMKLFDVYSINVHKDDFRLFISSFMNFMSLERLSSALAVLIKDNPDDRSFVRLHFLLEIKKRYKDRNDIIEQWVIE